MKINNDTNFSVDIVPMTYLDANARNHVATDQAIIRVDTGRQLGTVKGKRYDIFQNKDLEDFVRLTANIAKSTEPINAGCLHGGVKVFYQFAMPGELRINGTDDVSKPYITIGNSHSGKKSAFFGPGMIRIVCENTFNMASNEDSIIRITHSSPLNYHENEARRILGIAEKWLKEQNEIWNYLAEQRFNEEQANTMFGAVLPSLKENDSVRSTHIRERLNAFYATTEFAKLQGTALAALNAITNYVDHEKQTRVSDGGNEDEYRLDSALFGAGNDIKNLAIETILTMVRG